MCSFEELRVLSQNGSSPNSFGQDTKNQQGPLHRFPDWLVTMVSFHEYSSISASDGSPFESHSVKLSLDSSSAENIMMNIAQIRHLKVASPLPAAAHVAQEIA